MSYKFCYLLRTADALLLQKNSPMGFNFPFAVEGQTFTVDIYTCVCSAIHYFISVIIYVMITCLISVCCAWNLASYTITVTGESLGPKSQNCNCAVHT